MTKRATPIRSPTFRYPTRENTVLMKLDFEDHDRVWSLWVETGLRVYCMRLSYAANIDEQSPGTTVAHLNVGDNVFESMSDPAEDAKALAEQYVDMLLTLDKFLNDLRDKLRALGESDREGLLRVKLAEMEKRGKLFDGMLHPWDKTAWATRC